MKTIFDIDRSCRKKLGIAPRQVLSKAQRRKIGSCVMKKARKAGLKVTVPRFR